MNAFKNNTAESVTIVNDYWRLVLTPRSFNLRNCYGLYINIEVDVETIRLNTKLNLGEDAVYKYTQTSGFGFRLVEKFFFDNLTRIIRSFRISKKELLPIIRFFVVTAAE